MGMALLVLSVFVIIPPSAGWIEKTDVYVSDPDDLWWSGATSGDADTTGWITPPDNASWSPAVLAWKHPTWKRVKAASLYDAGADWFWRVYKVTAEEAKTGSIVFFKKLIEVPEGAENIEASIDITVDNAFYLYITNENDTGHPAWSGTPLMIDGFSASAPQDFWEADEYGMLHPRAGAIDTDSGVVRSIEQKDISANIKPGKNWLHIVAINAHPQPKDKQTSVNTAGLLYRLEVTWDAPLILPAGFMIPLELPPPPDLDYTLTPLTMYPVQAVWDADLEDDGVIDIVQDKLMAVQVSVAGITGVSNVTVNFDGRTITSNVSADDIFSCYPFLPSEHGLKTVSGSYVQNGVTVQMSNVTVKVTKTADLSISYSYIDGTGIRRAYGGISQNDYNNNVGNTTGFIESTFPIANLITDEAYMGLAGAEKSRKDPYKALLDDSIAAAVDAQWRLGGSAFGIAIAPDNTDSGGKDYFSYHGFSGAAGVSFGPSVRGVIALDGFYSGGAHELGHAFGLYYGAPEQYFTDPLYGKVAQGVDVIDGNWRSGICFMGAGPYETLEDSWVSNPTYEALFNQLLDPLMDPQVLLASGVIYTNGTVELNPWIRLADGYVDNLQPGELAFRFYDADGEIPDSEVSFSASYTVSIEPREGTTNSTEDFGTFATDYTSFSFATVLPDNTTYIEIVDYSRPGNPVLATVNADDLVFFDTWMTDSMFNEISGIESNFRSESDGTYTLMNSNPGSLMYNVMADYNGELKLVIELPNATNGAGIEVPAFEFVSQNPIHVYSDAGRTVDVTDSALIEIQGNQLNITMSIPSEELRYVTVHLDYALEGDPGWTFETGPSEYYQYLPIHTEYVSLDGEISLDLTSEFEAVGPE